MLFKKLSGCCLKRENMVSFLSILFIAAIGSLIIYMSVLHDKIIELMALKHASIYAQTIESFRTIYTSKVIKTLISKGVNVTGKGDDVIPTPMALIMELGKSMSKTGIDDGANIRLYSNYPFPWKTDGVSKDGFEKKALLEVKKKPDKPYYSFENLNGKKVLRFAKADIMKEDCVSCHNTYPDSPKKDWKVGDVSGVLEITLPMNEITLESAKSIRQTILLFVILGFLGVLGILSSINAVRN